MKLQLPPIQIRTFYLWGAILMSISVIGSIWNLVHNWGLLNNFGSKLTGVTGVLFNALWLGLFAFLYKLTPKQNPEPEQIVNSDELDNLLQELKKQEVIQNEQDNIENSNKKRER